MIEFWSANLDLRSIFGFIWIALTLAMYLKWNDGHLAIMKFFICHILFSAEFIRNPRKSSKLAMLGLDRLCAATKTILDLIRVQQTWHGWKANTLLTRPFWYSKIDPVFNILVALSPRLEYVAKISDLINFQIGATFFRSWPKTN